MSESKPSGCLVAIFKIFGRPPIGTSIVATPLPYKRKDWLLSKAERSFYGVLKQAVGSEYLIFAKIRLADLLWVPKGTPGGRQGHFNRVQAKHIDFVLCDQDNVRPFLAIEVDDSSHGASDRTSRDAFVDEAMRVAGLPMLRVRARGSYNMQELRNQIQSALAVGTSR
jgi:hypothetical protein